MTGPEPGWLREGETVPITLLRSIVNRSRLIEPLGG